MSAEKLLIGIDGGGSKTLALLANADGRILGRATAGSSNYHTVGKEQAFAALESAIAGSFADAGINVQPLDALCMGLAGVQPLAALCMGLAGVARPEDRALLLAWAEERFPGVPIALNNDSELVLAAGTPAGWGIALICGTGSIVLGRSRDGKSTRSDGWGFLLGDLGSGFAIGKAALQAVLAAHDGRAPATALSERILRECSLAAPPDLVRWVYRERIPTAEIAALAPLVEQAAETGDGIAQAILQQAGNQLADSVQAVATRLSFSGAIPLAMAGGVILRSRQIADCFRHAAAEKGLLLEPITPVLEPAIGAIRIAQRLL